MSMELRLIVFISFLAITLQTSGQEEVRSIAHKIQPNLLRKDLRVLHQQLKKIHVGLYNYTDEAKMNQLFDELESSLTTPLSAIEFYRKVVSLHGYIKNGHTIIIPPESFDIATSTTTPLFPMDVYWDKDSLYVLRNNSADQSIEEGSKINSINGDTASEVFQSMVDKWTRDGNNLTFPMGIAQRAFAGFYVNFFGHPEFYELELVNSSGSLEKTKVKALIQSEIEQNRMERYGNIKYYWDGKEGDAVTLEIQDDIAHLEIKTCSNSDIRKFGQSIKGIFKRKFKEIRESKVKHLIIDLRNNGGGDEIAAREVLKHLSEQPFKLFDDSFLKTKRISERKLYAENISLLNSFGKIGIKKGKDGFYRLNGLGRLFFRSNPLLKIHTPYKKRFKGFIYVLTNAYSFSASGELAALLKTNTKAIFIGEEPGGNSSEIVAGEVVTLELPHSKIRVRIPIVNQKIHSTSQPVDRGVIPDYQIRNSISDMISGRDAILEKTKNLITEVKEKNK